MPRNNQINKRTKFLKLEMYRKKYGCNQTVFAKLLGISTVTYSHKETRRHPFTFDEMEILYNFLNEKAGKRGDPRITLDELFLP